MAAISHVFTLEYVAEQLGEPEEWLRTTSREPTFATSANILLKTPGFLGARAPEAGTAEPFFSSGVLGTGSHPKV